MYPGRSLRRDLAHGFDPIEAVAEAQDFTWHSLLHANRLGMGQHLPDRLYWARSGPDESRLHGLYAIADTHYLEAARLAPAVRRPSGGARVMISIATKLPGAILDEQTTLAEANQNGRGKKRRRVRVRRGAEPRCDTPPARRLVPW